jgi:hypothetical protein
MEVIEYSMFGVLQYSISKNGFRNVLMQDLTLFSFNEYENRPQIHLEMQEAQPAREFQDGPGVLG